MKIALTGGGTGGHFYPIIAVAEAILDLSEEQRLITPQIIFMSDSKYDRDLVEAEGITFRKIYAGKMRRYFSFLNLTDMIKTAAGILKAVWIIYSDMPDVIFGKGGYVSLPVLIAARLFGIPVLIHESDTVPGKTNQWAGKFAKKIAISFPETAKYFPKEKIAITGTPVRRSILGHTPDEGREMFGMEKNIPVILVLGGSQGSQKINDLFLDTAPEIVKFAQVIHQSGTKNEKEVSSRLKVVMEGSLFKERYKIYPYLDDAQLRNASSVADLVVSRGGGTAIYEIAFWGLSSIIIPLSNSAQDHQRGNAYSYARSGACVVIEENNLSPHVLISEIQRIISDNARKESMKKAAKEFSKPDAGRKIAQELINLALEHSK